MDLNFGMKYLSDDEKSVSILFFTYKIANFIIYNIKFLNEEENIEVNGESNACPVMLIKCEKIINFYYPKDNSSSFNSIVFYLKDNTLNMIFKVLIKYDDNLPSIVPIIERE